jgi:hypothetical protein
MALHTSITATRGAIAGKQLDRYSCPEREGGLSYSYHIYPRINFFQKNHVFTIIILLREDVDLYQKIKEIFNF